MQAGIQTILVAVVVNVQEIIFYKMSVQVDL